MFSKDISWHNYGFLVSPDAENVCVWSWAWLKWEGDRKKATVPRRSFDLVNTKPNDSFPFEAEVKSSSECDKCYLSEWFMRAMGWPGGFKIIVLPPPPVPESGREVVLRCLLTQKGTQKLAEQDCLAEKGCFLIHYYYFKLWQAADISKYAWSL